MAADAATLASIREWVGSGPEDGELLGLFASFGSVERAARSCLARRRADLLDNPLVYELTGDAREDWSKNVDQLTRLIGELDALLVADGVDGPNDALGSITSSALLRPDRERLGTPRRGFRS